MRNLPARPDSAGAPRRLEPSLQSTAVAVLEPGAGDGCGLDALASRLRRRLAALPDLRRALDPHGPDDPSPDLLAHLERVVPTEAVSERALCALVGELSARPLDGSRPAWSLYRIEGLCGGLVALVLVVDHALADPGGCARLLTRLLGLEPARPPRERSTGTADRSGSAPAREERRRRCASPTARAPAEGPQPGPGSAPVGSRVSAYARSHRAAVDAVRRAFGGTREDVALAACTRALRRHLQAHGDAVTQPLVALLPCGSRGDDRDGGFPRRVRLPVQIQDPVDQLRVVQAETHRARLADRAASGGDHDLVFSYLPGPPRTLYLDDARLVALHPHGPLRAGVPLDIRVLGYGDSVDFGLMVCRERVPDAVEIAMGIDSAVADLVKRSFEAREGAVELAARS